MSVTGSYSPFDSIPEVGKPVTTVQSQGNSYLAPQVATISQLNVPQDAVGLAGDNGSGSPGAYGYAGYYIQLNNVTIVGASGNFATHANYTGTISDGTGSMIMFLWASSYITCAQYGGQPIPTGAVDMDGFVDYFTSSTGPGEAEFVPTSITAVVPEPSALNLCGAGSALAYVVSRLRKKA